jgi:amidase
VASPAPDPVPDLDRLTVADLLVGLDEGALTSRAVVSAHLEQIRRFDPVFGAIRCLAPSVLDEADASDRHREQSGPRRPLEGVPVLVKDNIDVAGLPTTAGALALAEARPAVDAPLISRLREAGAVILGKTNLSELANFLTEDMPSGYSSIGGQVLNPYDTSITPSGSSSGSATAAALGFAVLTVGTETDGSITSPADHQSVVGMKPTLGLVSRTGIVPIAASQDTAGPITRTVADALALLAAMAGTDPADPATAGADGTTATLRELVLDGRALDGAKLGVVRAAADPDDRPDPQQVACFDEALASLRGAGATLTDVPMPALSHDDELRVLHYEFGPGVDAYLERVGDGAPVRTLAELQAWNLAHAEAALKFGQTHVDVAVSIDHDRDRDQYVRARERDLAMTTAGLLAALGQDLDFLVFPGASGCSWAARAGWPSIVVPAGYTARGRRPVGVMFVGRPWHDAQLLAVAHAFEQAHPVRRPPRQLNPAVFQHL